MGHGSSTSRDFDDYVKSSGYTKSSTRTEDIYRSRVIDPDLDPKKFQIRESVDSTEHPATTPIIVSLDVSGSMSPVLDNVARNGLKTLCGELYDRKPVTDPNVCVVGIDDVEAGDQTPFQATQFEADIKIYPQLAKMYLESGGGGNNHESYILTWYFAKFRTSTDSYRKRGVKGWIFTIGDEEITPALQSEHFEEAMGDKKVANYTAQELYDLIYPEWNVYHIILKQGNHAAYRFAEVLKSWQAVLGQRVIALDDYTKLGETIVSILEVAGGKDKKAVVDSWDGTTKIAVASALADVDIPKGAVVTIDKYL